MLSLEHRSSEGFKNRLALMDGESSALSLTCHSRLKFKPLFGERDDLDLVSVREDTFVFSRWPKSFAKELAESGLFFTGNENKLKCYKCSIVLDSLNQMDDPRVVHRRLSPNCPIIQEEESSDEEDDVDDVDGVVKSPLAAPKTFIKEKSLATELKRNGVRRNIDKASLKVENERLKSAMTCCRCGIEKIQTLFLPCRHLITCEVCAETMDNCIKCQQKILGTVRTYMV